MPNSFDYIREVLDHAIDDVRPIDVKGKVIQMVGTIIKAAVPGFAAKVRADQGIRAAVRHMLAHPELQVPDPAFDAWCDRVIEALEKAKESI